MTQRTSAALSGISRVNTSMRILCIDQFAHIGGGQRSLLDLLPAFSQRGWRPSVAAPGRGRLTETVQKEGYGAHELICGNYSSTRKPPAQILKYACELTRLAKSLERIAIVDETELLYVNGPRMLPAAALVSRWRRIPMVFHCHNRLFQRSAIILAGTALRLVNAEVIACCEYAAAPLRKYLHPERVSILFNGVGEMAVHSRPGRDACWRIGIVGRVEAGKGHAEFVAAARIVSGKFPDCRFVIVGAPMFSGNAYYSKVIASSEDLPVDFLGWQDNIASVYSELDLLIVPSSSLEATTRVILEAYSGGLPVVAFPSGGIPEVLRDNETGFLTESATAEALARRIVSVLEMEQGNLAAVVRRAREEWTRRYTLKAYREGVCQVLARAAGLPASELVPDLHISF